MTLPILFENEITFHGLNVWALVLVILLFIIYFVYATKIYPRKRFKFIKPHKNNKSLLGKVNIQCEMYYAMYQRGGFKSPEKSHFVIHAFISEKSRNEFIRAMNNSHRKLYDENNTYVVAVTKDDIYVKQALDDVRKNPIIYNNLDYINQRIYVEHKEYGDSSAL